MRKVVEFFFALIMGWVLWFRYRIVYKGLENLNKETLNKPGGVLFLPNHPTVFVDPLAVTLGVCRKFPIRPMVVEYMYYTPILYSIFKFLDALPVPNFTTSSNSLKRKKTEKVMGTVIDCLRNKQNFLIYPAGKVKLQERELIGGASGVHQIIEAVPEANVVLVRTKGLWGSSFSSYQGGKAKPMVETILDGIKCCLKNLLFFTPRREVIIEFVPAPADFPYKGSRQELNHYLEQWYNQPDGLTPQEGKSPGDSLVLVSYSMWGEKYLEAPKEKNGPEEINFSAISDEIKTKVAKKISELADKSPESITPEQHLALDIGLDSLDIAELSGFLHDQFDIKGVPVSQLTSVGSVMGIAAKQIVCVEEEGEEADISRWKQAVKRTKLTLAEGDTIAEVFLNNSQRMGKSMACGDVRFGVLDYKELRTRVLLLAEKIRHMPGKYIGILLPASVAANVLMLAVEVAGKVPLMVNWTVGPRHLESVAKLSGVKVILSSWAFLDKLDNVDLAGIEDQIIMLEDLRREFTLWDKLRAALRSRRSTQSLLKTFKISKQNKSDPAVLLFTSGTENLPKGVPLSHENILSNLRAISSMIELYSDDVLFGILPPFHAFGFSVSSFLGLLSGLKIASFPDPTDGKRLAHGVEKWGVTLLCGAPTFLKGLFKVATPEQIATLRLCVTGAEKAPADLFRLLGDLGKPRALIEGYGITECSPVLTVNPAIGDHRGVGQALPGVELCIIDPETSANVPVGKQGMILARGPNIFSGYINPDVVSPFVEHEGKMWYKTGDLGFLDAEGYLTISGRQKRFVKIAGEMISLTAIEDSLLKMLDKQDVKGAGDGPSLAISAVEDPNGEKTKIVLFSCFPATTEAANSVLKEAGFSNLVRISTIIQLKEIPLMGSGKTNYRALEAEHLK